MPKLVALTVVSAVLGGIAGGQPAPDDQRRSPSFSEYRVAVYSGPIATAKPESVSDEMRLRSVLSTVNAEPNFAGRYRIVQFRMGDGPLGVVLVDAQSGRVFRLPRDVVGRDFYVPNTDCLALNRRWQHPATAEEDDSAPLSFTTTSELLIIRQCVLFGASVRGMRKDYYRWHGRKWHLVQHVSLPPPPPAPVY